MKLRKKEEAMICILPSLYIIIVFLIPLLGLGIKGSSLNTYFKAGVFFVFFAFLFTREIRAMANGLQGLFIITMYFISQLLAFLLGDAPMDVVSAITQLAMLVVLYMKYPLFSADINTIKKGIWVYLLFNFFAIGYNFVINIERYISFSFFSNVYYDMYSFFDNKNTYGIMLFIGYVLLFYLYSLTEKTNIKRKWTIATLIVIEYFAIMTSSCRTALLCATVFTVLTFLFVKPTSFKILLVLWLAAIAVLVYSIPFVQRYVLRVLLRTDVSTFREIIVEGSKQLIKKSPIFGYGEGGWISYLNVLSEHSYSHNGFLSVLMTGGAFYFIAYLFMFYISGRAGIKIKSNNKPFGLMIVFAIISVSLYSFFEGVVICGTSATNFSFCYAIVILPLMVSNSYNASPNEAAELRAAP